MTAEQESEYTALQDLVQSAGWKAFHGLVTAEIAGDFEEHITRALDTQDSALALDRMRQVASVRRAGMRWLKLPYERMSVLESLSDESSSATGWAGQIRRPVRV
jgi:hypothetical protein